MFERGSSGTWELLQKLTVPSEDLNPSFGEHVACGGDLLVAAATQEQTTDPDLDGLTGSGAVYVYRRTGKRYEQIARLVPENPVIRDGFGWGGVSVSGEYVAVARSSKVFGDGSTASVDIYRCDNTCELLQELETRASTVSSIVLRGDVLLVGAQQPMGGDGSDDDGSLYTARRVAGAWRWVARSVLTMRFPGEQFGAHVALSDQVTVVGAPYSAATLGRVCWLGFGSEEPASFAALDGYTSRFTCIDGTADPSKGLDGEEVLPWFGAPVAATQDAFFGSAASAQVRDGAGRRLDFAGQVQVFR